MHFSRVSKNYQQIKALNQIRIGSIMLIVAFSILILPTFFGMFFLAEISYSYGLLFFYWFGNIIRLPAKALFVAGAIVLMIGMKTLAKKNSESLAVKFNIAFILLICIIVVMALFETIMIVDLGAWDLGSFSFNFVPIIIYVELILYFGFLLLISYGLRDFKKEWNVSDKLLVSPFVYSIVVALQTIGLIFKFRTSSGFPYSYFCYTYYYYSIIVNVIFVSVAGLIDLIIKIVAFSEIIKETNSLKSMLIELDYQQESQIVEALVSEYKKEP